MADQKFSTSAQNSHVQRLVLWSIALLAGTNAYAQTVASSSAYYFEPSLFQGNRGSRQALERLASNQTILPGTYQVGVYLNQRFVTDAEIDWVSQDGEAPVVCVRRATFALLNIEVPAQAKGDTAHDCVYFDAAVPGATSVLDTAQLRLNLTVPQALIRQFPRGYVDPADLNSGESIGFVNYMANYYRLSLEGNGGNSASTYVALNGGINAGLWQLRHQSSISHSTGRGTSWNRVRTYVQRPIHAMGSQLTAGQTYTSGRIFSGLRFNGVVLETDDRMLPDSLRGFAPTIRGVASTNARVSVLQNGIEIYQTTVPSGPFVISDLYPTSYSGDLDVEILEANGATQRFTVPYAALPDSLRPGRSRYVFSLGRTHDMGKNSVFSELSYQRGISNALTLNSGLRLASGYQAATTGGVINTNLGAVGFGATYSRANQPTDGYVSGWMSQLSYSRTFQDTGTVVTLAGYRHSTSGYRDLTDALGARARADGNTSWQSNTYQQRNRFELTTSQSLGKIGNFFVSASTQDYHNGRSRDKQYQVGYGVGFNNGVSLNLTVARVSQGAARNQYAWQERVNSRSQGKETVTALSVSFPLGPSSSPRAASFNTTYTDNSNGPNSIQTAVSGMVDEAQTLSYSVGVSHENSKGSKTTWSGGLNKRMPVGSLGASFSKAVGGYHQLSVNGQGALAVHKGGLTLGPYLGNTFALVEAPGASGARILSARDVVIDGNGFALVPSLTPYRYNSIAIDPNGMSRNVELAEGEQRVAPYAGATVKLSFQTRSGAALLLSIQKLNGEFIPFGAQAYDSLNQEIGMAGQRGQVYVRVAERVGQIRLEWGDQPDQACLVAYDLTAFDPAAPIVRLASQCMPVT